MMTFLVIEILGFLITMIYIGLLARGEPVTYKELGIFFLISIVWPIGLPLMVCAVVAHYLDEKGWPEKMNKTAFTIPGGKS